MSYDDPGHLVTPVLHNPASAGNRKVLYKMVDGNRWYLRDASGLRCLWTRFFNEAKWFSTEATLKKTRRFVRREWGTKLSVDTVANCVSSLHRQ